MLEKTLLEELNRFRAINKYGKKMIMEQDVPAPTEPALTDPATAEPNLAAPDAASTETPAPVEPAAEPTLDSTEEIDITDLVNMTKSVKKDIEDNKQDHSSVLNKMDDVFTKLNDLEQKLSQMDSVMAKIDQLGSKVEAIKEPTPQERLEMRSLDSYPFNENPQQFFAHKQDQMKASGKNEYVLTKQDVSDYSNDMMKSSFNPTQQEDEFKF